MASGHYLIVEARFYEELADELVAGAVEALESCSATYDRVSVPGALEIPAAMKFAEVGSNKHYDGYIAIGVVIRGETTHYDYVCGESARALMDLSIMYNMCIGNGIQTVEDWDQAWARANRTDKNKGGGASKAAVALVNVKQEFGAKSVCQR